MGHREVRAQDKSGQDLQEIQQAGRPRVSQKMEYNYENHTDDEHFAGRKNDGVLDDSHARQCVS